MDTRWIPLLCLNANWLVHVLCDVKLLLATRGAIIVMCGPVGGVQSMVGKMPAFYESPLIKECFN